MSRHIKLAGLSALLALLPYTLGLPYPFVYDDHAVIEENGFLRQPDAWTITLTGRTLFDKRIPDGGRPVVILTYLLDRAMWGNKTIGYRISNHLIQALVLCLVYTLAWKLTVSHFVAFSATLLFGLHPLSLEVVQSPAFREDLLVTAGLLGFLLSAGHPGQAILLLLIALCAKESGIMAPPLLLWLWLCFPNRRPSRSTCVATLGFGLMLAIALLAIWASSGTFQALSLYNVLPPLAFPSNLLTAPWLFVRLLRFMVWPHPLRADHVIAPVTSAWDARFLIGAAVGLAWIASAWKLKQRWPLVAFGLGWIGLAFIPVSNIIPLHNPFAERYAYLPCLGFAMILAHTVSTIRSAKPRAAVLATISALYALGIVVPLRAWSSEFALWQRVLAYEPRSARAWTWTGLELKHRGLRQEALRHFQRALALNTNESAALVNIGVMLGEDGKMEDAERVLREAVRRRPDKAETWWNLAVCLHLQGCDDEATVAAQRARDCNPYFLPAAQLFAEPLTHSGGPPSPHE